MPRSPFPPAMVLPARLLPATALSLALISGLAAAQEAPAPVPPAAVPPAAVPPAAAPADKPLVPEVGMYFGRTEAEIRDTLAAQGLQMLSYRHEASYDEVHASLTWQRWILKIAPETGRVLSIEQE